MVGGMLNKSLWYAGWYASTMTYLTVTVTVTGMSLQPQLFVM